MQSKKRIVYVMATAKFSGAEIVLTRMIEANLEQIDPLIICVEGTYAERLRQKGMEVIHSSALQALEMKKQGYSKAQLIWKILRNAFRLSSLLLKIQFTHKNIHAIHTNNPMPSAYALPGLLISRLLFRSTKWFRHHYDISFHDLPPGAGKLLNKLCNYWYHQTFVPSQATRAAQTHLQSKVSVLYNGIDIAHHQCQESKRKAFRDQYQIPNEAIAIGIAGKIVVQKGHKLLLQAFKELFKKNLPVYVLVAGNYGNEEAFKPELMKILDQEELQRRCIFMGFVSDLSKFYSGIDILVNATLQEYAEPLGTSIIEGMAYERVVVVSRAGGSPEIIDDQENGFLFKPDDELDLQSKLEYICQHFSEMAHIQKKARQKVEAKFTIQQTIIHYNTLIGL